MHNPNHPDSVTLDRLRAGLLDDDPQEKLAVEQHLARCTQCRKQYQAWQQLAPNALGPELDERIIAQWLRNARGAALAGRKRQHHVPMAGYATAALLLIAVSIGIWNNQTGTDGQVQVAVYNEQGEVPDIYEDLEFYMWLATQEDADNGNGNGDSNPNST